MKSKVIDIYKGLTQLEHLEGKTQLVYFEAIDSNWKELFRWIMSVGKQVNYYDKNGNKDGNFAELWMNHIYTVLIDILQCELKNSESEFIRNARERQWAQEATVLESHIRGWLKRIDLYIRIRMMRENDIEKCSAMQVAKNIKKELELSLNGKFDNVWGEENTDFHCAMWKAISTIKKKGDSYLHLIENAGNMDPGLSLLLVFIRNYCKIISGFNQRLTSLPDFYYNRILMVSPRKVIQDRVNLLLTPSDAIKGYLLPSKTKFIADKKVDGTELIYETEQDEYISGMNVADAFTVFQTNANGVEYYKKSLDIHGGTLLKIFEKDDISTSYSCGWMIESRIFLVKDGKVNINIIFSLTKESVKKISKTPDVKNAFNLYLSDSKGWSLVANTCEYKLNLDSAELTISIKEHIIKDSLVPTSDALHNMSSDFPILRVVIKNKKEYYDFFKLVEFEKIVIQLNVAHSHNIQLYNELGEIDVSKPFYPLGIQAECSSWFRFGNEELIQKNINSIEISGVWNKIPKTEHGYEDIYRYWYYKKIGKEYIPDIKIKTDSFKIGYKVINEGKWEEINSFNNLFSSLQGVVSEKASINFKWEKGILLNNDDIGLNKSCLFCVTLKEPCIGFGMEEYRNVFAERMIYNSNPKTDDENKRPLPTPPLIPMLADLELSYNASEILEFNSMAAVANNRIRISRITDLNEYKFNPIEQAKIPLFVSEDTITHSLYLGISNALNKKHINMYFDLSDVTQNQLQQDLKFKNRFNLKWSYSKKCLWNSLESKYVLIDDTCGFTQSGYIKLELPELITEDSLDCHNLLWLKVSIENGEDVSVTIRDIYIDYIAVVAENGDGLPILPLSINKLKEENIHINKIIQPLSGYGGKAMESKKHSSVRQYSQISNRLRALTPVDYEQMILERFPEIEKVYCIPMCDLEKDGNISMLRLVVFSRSNDTNYPHTPSWKLEKIRKYISDSISPYTNLSVINPWYEYVEVKCIATVKVEVTADGETIRRIVESIETYFAGWIRKKILPDLSQNYSCKTLHNIIANDKDVVKIYELSIAGVKICDTDINAPDQYICGKTPWSVIIPRPITLNFLLYTGGIGHSMIEYNFIIK